MNFACAVSNESQKYPVLQEKNNRSHLNYDAGVKYKCVLELSVFVVCIEIGKGLGSAVSSGVCFEGTITIKRGQTLTYYTVQKICMHSADRVPLQNRRTIPPQ